MILTSVKDVLGPLPVAGECYIILSAKDLIFPIPCNFADASICHSLLTGTGAETPFEFLTDTLEIANTSIVSTELHEVSNSIYGKIFLKNDSKNMKKSSSNPCMAINTALAAKAEIKITNELANKINDATVEYHRLKGAIGDLWLLPQLTSTELLELLCEFIEKIQFRQAV